MTWPCGTIDPVDVMIRRGQAADARAAADLWLRSRKAAAEAIPPNPCHSDDDVRGWFASHVVRNLELWIAQSQEGQMLGILVLDGELLDQLYVDPANLRCGIGSRLVEVAKRERPSGLRVWTFTSNSGAQRFYEYHGFVEVQRTDGSGNEERAPDIQYAYLLR